MTKQASFRLGDHRRLTVYPASWATQFLGGRAGDLNRALEAWAAELARTGKRLLAGKSREDVERLARACVVPPRADDPRPGHTLADRIALDDPTLAARFTELTFCEAWALVVTLRDRKRRKEGAR